MPNSRNLKALLIDLNGTLHIGHEATRGAVRALERLRAARIPFVLCSNSTKESTQSLLTKLRGMGFNADNRELMTSLGACRLLVEDRGLRPYLIMSPSAQEEFARLPSSSTSHPFDSVIVGLHEPSLDYSHMNTAFRILKSEPISHESTTTKLPRLKPILIAPHTSMFQQSPSSDDMPAGLSLGIGPFVRALELASGVQAEIVGKPTRRFFEMALERMRAIYPEAGEMQPSDVGIIGDDVVNDLGEGARELGMRRILVRTGKYRKGAEETEYPPDETFANFADFVTKLLQPNL